MEVAERNRLVESVVPWCAALVNRHVERVQDRPDALQVVLLRVLRGLPSYRPEKGALTTWTAAVVVRTLHPSRRRQEPATVSLPVKLPDARQRLAEDHHDDAEQCQRIQAVLAKLDAEDRAILTSVVIEGRSAAAFDRSVSRERNRVRLNRALRNARQLMAN